jgi:outer membrane protein W
MKKTALFCLLLCTMAAVQLRAQEKKFNVGLNFSGAPFLVAEPAFEYFLWDWISADVIVGYCPGRRYRAMQNVRDRISGGFVTVGPRFYLPNTDNLRPFLGIGLIRGDFNREIIAEIDHYFGTYTETATVQQRLSGWYIRAGVHWQLSERFILQPGLQVTVIQPRDDPYGYDYWTPGVGPAGYAFNAPKSRNNFGIRLLLMGKITL